MTAHWYNPYDRLAPFYDWMSRTMLLPFGGERAFRRRALALLAIEPGTRVLELGCGTGSNTRELIAMGAEVTAVDLSEPMLERARRRAPGARFVHGDILAQSGSYDRVLLGWVLHEMDSETRAATLAVAAAALHEGGLCGVLEFAGGAPPLVDVPFRAYLRLAEPELASELLALGQLESEIEHAGLTVLDERHLALGTARMIVARPAPPGRQSPAPSSS